MAGCVASHSALARYTATVSDATKPLETLPVTVASSSAAPSLKTLSDASEICDALDALLPYPLDAYTRSFATFGSAICDVAILFDTLVDDASVEYTSK